MFRKPKQVIRYTPEESGMKNGSKYVKKGKLLAFDDYDALRNDIYPYYLGNAPPADLLELLAKQLKCNKNYITRWWANYWLKEGRKPAIWDAETDALVKKWIEGWVFVSKNLESNDSKLGKRKHESSNSKSDSKSDMELTDTECVSDSSDSNSNFESDEDFEVSTHAKKAKVSKFDELVKEASSELEKESFVELVIKPVSQSIQEPVSQPVLQPIQEPVSQPIPKPVSQTVFSPKPPQSVSLPVLQPIPKPEPFSKLFSVLHLSHFDEKSKAFMKSMADRELNVTRMPGISRCMFCLPVHPGTYVELDGVPCCIPCKDIITIMNLDFKYGKMI